MGKNNISGAWGESIAADYLLKKKYKITATNYRCKFGEIDLIVENRNYLVFVEVKLRKSDSFASAADFVDVFKQNRLRTTAQMYLSLHPTDLQPRFDVIEIYAPEGIKTSNPRIIHMESAFE